MEQAKSTQAGDHSAAKFAFLYLLALVSLGFVATSVGMVIFQIINKNIVDIATSYYSGYDMGSLRFAISAIIVAAPIYYVSTGQINKSLTRGTLDEDAGVRRWLTYFVLLVSSVTAIGDLIALVNSFLSGELTIKFLLKAITVLVIAAVVFSYYLYDIRREEVQGKKDKVVSTYFYATLVIVLAALISSFFFVESPAEARQRRIDNEIVNNMQKLENAISEYHTREGSLPADLAAVVERIDYVTADTLQNPVTQADFEYHITGDTTYELCTDWQRSNLNDEDSRYEYYNVRWQHDAGYSCITKEVAVRVDEASMKSPQPVPVR